MKKILLTGGGSAGHVTPNISIYKLLKEKGFEMHYIGQENGMERGLIEPLGIPYHGILAGKLRRYFDFKNFTDVFRIIAGFFQSIFFLSKIRPGVVFSKGGFVACPVVWAAWVLRIPVVIHESDISPGLANRLSLPFARKVCLTFEASRQYVGNQKSILTGLPVREAIHFGKKETAYQLTGFSPDKPVLLIMGGSQGAKAINEVIREDLDRLVREFQICHLCGAGHKADIEKKGYFQLEYAREELPDLLAMADLVISRAGATSIFEFLSLRKPSILVPLPRSASRGDQILNAEIFKKAGYAEVLFQEDLNADALYKMIIELFNKREEYVRNMEKSKAGNATDSVVEVIRRCL
jgi:UDP-N-acetylglucosamine--N-acetylmuramyl-(pentapeptide) pyrophosphoryl-undecaprenol N-acetylglucosamine transferase